MPRGFSSGELPPQARTFRAEAGEAAGILEGLVALGVTHPDRAAPVLELLWRLSGMLYRLAHPRR